MVTKQAQEPRGEHASEKQKREAAGKRTRRTKASVAPHGPYQGEYNLQDAKHYGC